MPVVSRLISKSSTGPREKSSVTESIPLLKAKEIQSRRTGIRGDGKALAFVEVRRARRNVGLV